MLHNTLEMSVRREKHARTVQFLFFTLTCPASNEIEKDWFWSVLPETT